MRTQSPPAWYTSTAVRAVALAISCWVTALTAQQSGSISNIAQFYATPAEELAQGHGVLFRATVLYSDPEWNQLFLQDATGSIHIHPPLVSGTVQTGDYAELEGRTTVTDGTAALTGMTIRKLGRATWPEPIRLSVPALLSGRAPKCWVEISGTVQAFHDNAGRLCLEMASGGEKVVLHTQTHSPEDRWRLLDAKVVTRGAWSGTLLFVQDARQIKVIEPAAQDFLMLPFTPIGHLSKVHQSGASGRVRVTGVVDHVRNGRGFVLRDATGTVRVESDIPLVAEDDHVDLVAHLKVAEGTLVLENAAVRSAASPSTGNSDLPSGPETISTKELPILTRARDVHRLGNTSASLGHEVHLTAVITYCDSEWNVLFVQDDSGGIFVAPGDQRPELVAGQQVEIKGISAPGNFAPVIARAEFKVLGPGALPRAREVTVNSAALGNYDSTWVQIDGVVQSLNENGTHLYLNLMGSEGAFRAVIPNLRDQPRPDHLLDARVRVNGVCGAVLNERSQITGVLLHVPRLSEIEVLEPAPQDPFTIESQPIATLLRFDPERLPGRRVKITGVVTYQQPGLPMAVQDDTGGLLVTAQQATTPVAVGDEVEVVGFPVMEGLSPVMKEALLKKTGTRALPAPTSSTARQILTGRHDGELVQLEARLLEDITLGPKASLVLQDGPVIFTALLERMESGHAQRQLKAGSVIRATGLCSIQASEWRKPQSFRLLLNNPGDLQVLRQPSWWTVRHVAAVAGTLFSLTLITLIWVLTLSRKNALLREQVAFRTRAEESLRKARDELESRVQERTAELSSRTRELACANDLFETLLNNIPDRVYFKDRESRFVKCSRAILHPLGLSDPSEVMGKTDFDLFTPEHARPAFNDEQAIIRTGKPRIGQVEKETWQNNRVTWALTTKMPWRDRNGKIIGTFGISTDITALKAAEVELERTHRQLVETSRQAGMAEVATGVLHNVGNVLNSVNVSANLAAARVRKSKVSGLARVVALLREHKGHLGEFLTSHAQGEHLPNYLERLSHHLSAEQAELLRELSSLTSNIEHIKQIVAMQQSYARVVGVFEKLSLRDLVEDALRMHEDAFARHQIRLEKDYDDVPPVTVDKHKVLQILVNLLTNAKHACNATGNSNPQVTLRIFRAGEETVAVEVSDNGEGIPPENLTRIFAHGFTTRKEGHGFGLHSSANAAREMNGRLTAQSAGAGHGATFTLELPVSQEHTDVSLPIPSTEVTSLPSAEPVLDRLSA